MSEYSNEIGKIAIDYQRRKILIMLFVLSFHLSYAGTGSAKDVIFFYLVIIGILAIPFAIYFIVDLTRKIIKKSREKKTIKSFDEIDNNNYLKEL